MVTQATSLTGNGLSDWLIQQLSAVVLAVYTLCVALFLVLHSGLTYEQWVGFFGGVVMQLFSTLTLLVLLAHAWVGLWTVGTDYFREHYFGSGATSVRLCFQVLCAVVLFVYGAWGLQIIWEV